MFFSIRTSWYIDVQRLKWEAKEKKKRFCASIQHCCYIVPHSFVITLPDYSHHAVLQFCHFSANTTSTKRMYYLHLCYCGDVWCSSFLVVVFFFAIVWILSLFIEMIVLTLIIYYVFINLWCWISKLLAWLRRKSIDYSYSSVRQFYVD